MLKYTGKMSSARILKEKLDVSRQVSFDRKAAGVVAVAASLAGLGGLAVGTLASLEYLPEELELEFTEFELDGRLFRSGFEDLPFSPEDELEVVAAPSGGHLWVQAINCPKTRRIALGGAHERGRARYALYALKWWLMASAALVLAMGVLLLVSVLIFGDGDVASLIDMLPMMIGIGGGLCLVFSLCILFKYGRETFEAERIFSCLGWQHPWLVDVAAMERRAGRIRRSILNSPSVYHY